MKIKILDRTTEKPHIKFHENMFIGWGIVPSRRKGGQTDMTKLIFAFHNFSNAPKNMPAHLYINTFYLHAISVME